MNESKSRINFGVDMFEEIALKADIQPAVVERVMAASRLMQLVARLVDEGRWYGDVPVGRYAGSRWKEFMPENVLIREMFDQADDGQDSRSESLASQAETVAETWLRRRQFSHHLSFRKIARLIWWEAEKVDKSLLPDVFLRFEVFIATAIKVTQAAGKLEPELPDRIEFPRKQPASV